MERAALSSLRSSAGRLGWILARNRMSCRQPLPTPQTPGLLITKNLTLLGSFSFPRRNALEVFVGERVAQRRYPRLADPGMGRDLGVVEQHRRAPALHRDRQIAAVGEMEQQLVLLGQRLGVAVQRDPLAAAAERQQIVRLDGASRQSRD